MSNQNVQVSLAIHVNGIKVLSGGDRSVRGVFNNLTGRGFQDPDSAYSQTHAGYLAFVNRNFALKGTTVSDGDPIQLVDDNSGAVVIDTRIGDPDAWVAGAWVRGVCRAACIGDNDR